MLEDALDLRDELEEGFDDVEEEDEEDELAANGMHVDGDDDELPIEEEER